MSEALIYTGTIESKISNLVPTEELFRANDLTIKTISVTSSLTPLIDVN